MGRLTGDQKMIVAVAFLAVSGAISIGYGVFSSLTEKELPVPLLEDRSQIITNDNKTVISQKPSL
jgi:hypothetical protein